MRDEHQITAYFVRSHTNLHRIDKGRESNRTAITPIRGLHNEQTSFTVDGRNFQSTPIRVGRLWTYLAERDSPLPPLHLILSHPFWFPMCASETVTPTMLNHGGKGAWGKQSVENHFEYFFHVRS